MLIIKTPVQRDLHSADFVSLISQIILNVQHSAPLTYKAAASNSCFTFLLQLLPLWGLKADSRNSPHGGLGTGAGYVVSVRQNGVKCSSAGWQPCGDCFPPRFCQRKPFGVGSGHHKWEQQLPSIALCCQQHVMSGTRLLFFCKFTKSLMPLSHFLPQWELNLQLLVFLFISVA